MSHFAQEKPRVWAARVPQSESRGRFCDHGFNGETVLDGKTLSLTIVHLTRLQDNT